MNSVAEGLGVFLAWALLLLGIVLVLAYRRASLWLSCGVLGLLLLSYWAFGTAPEGWKITVSIPYALLLGVLVAILDLIPMVGSTVGGIIVSLVAFRWAPPWLAYLAWGLGGSGMGLGVSSISVLLLDLSPEHERGFSSSAVQLADMIGTVLLVGVGGVLINALGSTARPTLPLFVFDIAMCGVALFGGIVSAGRTAGRLR